MVFLLLVLSINYIVFLKHVYKRYLLFQDLDTSPALYSIISDDQANIKQEP